MYTINISKCKCFFRIFSSSEIYFIFYFSDCQDGFLIFFSTARILNHLLLILLTVRISLYIDQQIHNYQFLTVLYASFVCNTQILRNYLNRSRYFPIIISAPNINLHTNMFFLITHYSDELRNKCILIKIHIKISQTFITLGHNITVRNFQMKVILNF